MSDDIFINYTHPNQQADRWNRRRVLQYVGIHFRNRSAPSSRRAALAHARQNLNAPPPERAVPSSSDGQELRRGFPFLTQSVPRDHSGLRRDPFSSFPTRHGGDVAPTVDYYVNFYAPAHLIRPDIVSVEGGANLVQQHFHYALQHPVMFEAIIALAHANCSISDWTDHGADRLTLHHYGQAISKLRQSLSDTRECMEDATLFAIMALIGVNYLLSDLTAFQSNLMGLRRIVALRGGIDTLGWPTLLKPGLVGLEYFWTYISNQPHLMEHQMLIPSMPDPMVDVSTNPRDSDPFLGIEDMLPRLPVGFRALAEQRRMGTKLLQLIIQVAEFDVSLRHAAPTYFVHRGSVRKFVNWATQDGREITVASNLQVCEQLAKLLVYPGLTVLEKACCIGMFIVQLGSTRSEQLSSVYFAQLQHHARELLNMPLEDADPAARDLMAWTIVNVASTMVPSKLSSLPESYQDDPRFALTMKLVEHFAAHTWEQMRGLFCKFIWSIPCMNAWKPVWDMGMQHVHTPRQDL